MHTPALSSPLFRALLRTIQTSAARAPRTACRCRGARRTRARAFQAARRHRPPQRGLPRLHSPHPTQARQFPSTCVCMPFSLRFGPAHACAPVAALRALLFADCETFCRPQSFAVCEISAILRRAARLPARRRARRRLLRRPVPNATHILTNTSPTTTIMRRQRGLSQNSARACGSPPICHPGPPSAALAPLTPHRYPSRPPPPAPGSCRRLSCESQPVPASAPGQRRPKACAPRSGVSTR